MNDLAPIILFVYNREKHTAQTLEALQSNELANESNLYVYSDGPKDHLDIAKIRKVRERIKKATGFKEIKIIERETNFGLAKNIVDGVTSVLKEYGKVIVLEDDIVTSKYFLKFMNDALDHYEDKKKVFHISGWNYPIDEDELEDVFFWRVMNCWGWGTWHDRWQFFEKDPDKLIKEFSKERIKYFDLDNSGIFWRQVINNHKGRSNTWGVFWYASIYKNGGLCLNPVHTFTKNIGDDGSGINHRSNHKLVNQDLSMKSEISFKDTITESSIAVERIKRYYRNRRSSIPERIIRKLKKLMTS